MGYGLSGPGVACPRAAALDAPPTRAGRRGRQLLHRPRPLGPRPPRPVGLTRHRSNRKPGSDPTASLPPGNHFTFTCKTKPYSLCDGLGETCGAAFWAGFHSPAARMGAVGEVSSGPSHPTDIAATAKTNISGRISVPFGGRSYCQPRSLTGRRVTCTGRTDGASCSHRDARRRYYTTAHVLGPGWCRGRQVRRRAPRPGS